MWHRVFDSCNGFLFDGANWRIGGATVRRSAENWTQIYGRFMAIGFDYVADERIEALNHPVNFGFHWLG